MHLQVHRKAAGSSGDGTGNQNKTRLPNLAEFFLFLVQIQNIFQIWSRFKNIFKTRPFGPATMHGGANELYPATHGGGV